MTCPPLAVHSLWTVFTYKGRSFEPKMRLRGDVNLPSVDIFIVSSGQTDQTVFDCAVAAASMDYPSHRYRVLVLDPLGSANLERELNKHAKTQACPHLTYHRRDLGDGGTLEKTENEKPKKSSSTAAAETQQAKSNSINFGMREAASLGMKGPSEFIAVFDADVSSDPALHSRLRRLGLTEFTSSTGHSRTQLFARRPPAHPRREQGRARQDSSRVHQPAAPPQPTDSHSAHRR